MAHPNKRRVGLEQALRSLAPQCPAFDVQAVIDHAVDAPGLRHAAADKAVWLSLVAYIRHVYTDYDQLLDDGYDGDSARFFVCDAINDVLSDWAATRRVDGGEIDGDGAF